MPTNNSNALLAVDLGVRCGFAQFAGDGKLRWYRSRNLGSAARLRRGVAGILTEAGPLTHLLLEGGGDLAEPWKKEAARAGIVVRMVSAEKWRESLLLPRERNGASTAKQQANVLARRVIEWSELQRPTSLRHDAAEAILAGLWGVRELGWLDKYPDVLNRIHK